MKDTARRRKISKITQVEITPTVERAHNIYLSVIFPIRVDKDREYILPRLAQLLKTLPVNNKFEFIFVDSGSMPSYAMQIEEICKNADGRTNFRYIYHNTMGEMFAAGKARDYGAQHAKGQFIMFQDVDLVGKTTFYDDIIEEIHCLEMEKYVQEFFLVPCFYLTQEGSVEFLESTQEDLRFRKLMHLYNEGQNNYKDTILNFAPSTSIMVVNRMHFLALGGHSKEFYGHGCEDFELLHRLVRYSKKFQGTYDYYLNKSNYDSIEYEGFRAYFSMWGYQTLQSGMFMVHIWHPRPQTSYVSNVAKNREIMEKKMKEFDSDKTQRTGPTPLSPLLDHHGYTTLVFDALNTNPMRALRQIIPMLGQIIIRNEITFTSDEQFLLFVRENKINRVLFTNPYGNSFRLKVYRLCKENNISYIVYERGALPDSWFFDPSGFNSDSKTYDAKNWDKPLTNDEQTSVEEYISDLVSSGQTLEKNGARIGGEQLRINLDAKYRIGNRKILFIPFQRPSDTVTNYFAGNAGNFEGFCQIVDDVYRKLDKSQWFIVCKKHPLETVKPYINPDILFVDDQTHVYDLLSACDKVLLMNSGVGVLAMLFGKPTCCVSEIFYGHSKINYQAKNSDDAASFINSNFQTSFEHICRFIHYLKTKVYSFGIAQTHERKEADGSLRSITTAINFYEVRGIDGKEYFWQYRKSPIQWNSPAYGLFLASIVRRHRQKAEEAKKKVAEPTKPALAPAKSPIAVPSKPIVLTLPKVAPKAIPPKPIAVPVKAEAKLTNPVAQSVASMEHITKGKKWNKFKRDPHKFFADAKNPLVRGLKVFFKK